MKWLRCFSIGAMVGTRRRCGYRQSKKNLYQLENSPFFAIGLSWEDTIEAKPGESGVLEYKQCVKKSGNRTLRIMFEEFRLNEDPAQHILNRLSEMGASYEGMQPRLVSLNVPPEVNLASVTDYLSGQSGIQWEYADPTYEQVIKERVV
jgi:hypothetical protein